MQGGDTLKETLALPGLPDRPSRATRLRISAEFLSVDRLRVQVSDLGFGELFPSSDLTWSEEVDLGGPVAQPAGESRLPGTWAEG